MSKKLRELQSKKADLVAAMRDLTTKAETENRDLSAEESASFDNLRGQVASANASIERETDLIAAEAQIGIQSALPSIEVSENSALDPKGGFNVSGEFFKAVIGAARAKNSGAPIDQRLLRNAAVPAVFGGEGSGSDGGFAVPPEFAKDIFTLSLSGNSLLPYCDEVKIDGNSMSFPKDETTPWGTNGVRAYWQGEGQAGTPTKPMLGMNTLRLKKLMALVPISDELLEDTSALSSYLPKKVGESIQWKTNEAILNGVGNAVPYGALKSGAAVVQAKDSGQATNTLTALNLANMIARLPEGSFGNAIWIINNNVLPALFTLSLGNYPIYLPLGGGEGAMKGSPYGMLLGRPVMVSQHAASFSSQGDVNLLDLSYYQAITKADGIEMATSMHLYFDADATAFRTLFRMDGLSKLSAPIDPANGSTTLSPFIQLGAR